MCDNNLPMLQNIKTNAIVSIYNNYFTIGRGIDSNYISTCKMVSREHCTLIRTENNLWVLKDTSSNGTMVNNVLIHQRTSEPLRHGDTICLGDDMCTYLFILNNNHLNQNNPPNNDSNKADSQISSTNNVISISDDDHNILRAAADALDQLESNENEALAIFNNEHDYGRSLAAENEADLNRSVIVINESNISNFNRPAEFIPLPVIMSNLHTNQTGIPTTVFNINNRVQSIPSTSNTHKRLRVLPESFPCIAPSAVIDLTTDDNVSFTDNTDNLIKIKTEESSNNTATPPSCSPQPGTSKSFEIKDEEEEEAKRKSASMSQIYRKEREEMETELMCSICINLFIKTVTLGCSHSFCHFCIEEWKKNKLVCPICRVKISGSSRTLVLDNIIEKLVENGTEEAKKSRKEAIESREKIETERACKSKISSVRGRGNGRARSRGRNTAGTSRTTPIADFPRVPLIDSDSSTDSTDGEFDLFEIMGHEESSSPYYGGYGRCYSCGRRGHWANSCPYSY